jgi:putative transposase
MSAVHELSAVTGLKWACESLGMPRASYYRALKAKASPRPPKRVFSPLALSADERGRVLDILRDERFVDKAPQEIHAILLDEGDYLCSWRTMYRYLHQEGEVRERRQISRHAAYAKPELLAEGPNQVWSWDITKLKGPEKWSYFYLYVILDIYSRCVVGWTVSRRESAELAQDLLSETYDKHGITPDQLTVHADRGPSMKSGLVANLLCDLGVTKTHNRPYNSNDNPYSESQFKTLKYRPSFPKNFGCLEDARAFCRSFFQWYNCEHRHSGINMLTPLTVHFGNADVVLGERNRVLQEFFKKNPARFKYNQPALKPLPQAVWINKPETPEKEAELLKKLHVK